MSVQRFYLLGEPTSSAKEIEVGAIRTLIDLKDLLAAHFAVVEPSGETVSPLSSPDPVTY